MKKVVRSVGVASVAVAFGAGAALSAPIAGAQSSLPGGSLGADTCGEQIVTPATLDASGWLTPDDETAAVIAAVEDAPESVGNAALTFETDASGTSLYKDGDEADLSDLLLDGEDLVPISFDYTSGGQAPALQIRLNDANLHESEDGAGGSDIGFATIVWSPPAAEGWDTADPGDSGEFWVTRALDGPDGEPIPRATPMTLDEIIDLNPEAVVTEYGVQKTRDNTADDVAIDNFTLGCETTNFELDPEGSLENVFGSVTGIFES